MRDPRPYELDAATVPGTKGRYRIGPAELRLDSREIYFDGVAVEVQPKVLDLLAYLVLCRDRVVSKDELFDKIWPTVVVSDASLSQAIKRVRDLFRDHGFEGDIIRTVSRRGYQFHHEVLTCDDVREVNQNFRYLPGEGSTAPAAQDAVMRAARELETGSASGARRAEQLYRQVLENSPDNDEATLGLSEALRRLGVSGAMPREQAFHESLMLAERVVRRSPENGRAYLQLAELKHRHFWDFDGAGRSFDQALTLIPGSAELQAAFSRFLAKTGDVSGALQTAREAVRLDPASADARGNLILRLLKVCNLEEAWQALETLRDMHPEHGDLPWLEANLLLKAQRYREALQVIAREELAHLRLSLSVMAYRHLGRTAQATRALQELVDTDGAGAAFQIAETYADASAVDEAFDWLMQALANGDPGMAELYSSLHLECLYDDPRFARIASEVGLPPRQ